MKKENSWVFFFFFFRDKGEKNGDFSVVIERKARGVFRMTDGV